MLKCYCVISKFNSHAGNTVALVVENNRLHLLKSTSHVRTCLKIDCYICMFNCSSNSEHTKYVRFTVSVLVLYT